MGSLTGQAARSTTAWAPGTGQANITKVNIGGKVHYSAFKSVVFSVTFTYVLRFPTNLRSKRFEKPFKLTCILVQRWGKLYGVAFPQAHFLFNIDSAGFNIVVQWSLVMLINYKLNLFITEVYNIYYTVFCRDAEGPKMVKCFCSAILLYLKAFDTKLSLVLQIKFKEYENSMCGRLS